MKIRCIIETASVSLSVSLTKNKIYEVLSIEKGWYRIIDDTDEDYLFPPDYFVVVDDGTEDDIWSGVYVV